VEAIFEAVIDLDPADAARRLDEECAGDEALRAAVERLVAADRAAGPGFLAPPGPALAEALGGAELDATVPAAHRGPEQSARIGRFFVLRVLGEGGMGVVYVGYDETLDRRVALKLLHRGAAGGAWLKREGQALGRLAHPNVVAVHEIGEHEGRVFLAMELVEGLTLRAWLASTPRAFAEVCGMFVQAGKGLAAAHAAGLVHRDFKPDNVLVGADGRARVADFGIAALAGAGSLLAEPEGDAPGSPERLLTQRGALVGTPAFMAPELLRMERATPASDQWAFCVALYKAAYGAAPFPADDLPSLLKAVAEDPPAPPPRREDVPAWLAPIVLRGLAKDPAARFSSMDAFLEAIEQRLPRHPELDPMAVRRERLIFSAALFLTSLSIAALVFGGGAVSTLSSPWIPVRIAAGLLVVALTAVALLRRRLATSLYGRQSASFVVITFMTMLAHRLAAVPLGTPLPDLLVVDSILLAAMFAAAAVMLERGLAWASLVALASAVAGILQPAWALRAFAAASFGVTATLVLVWGRRT
jgi:serine/threonine-protein kinase